MLPGAVTLIRIEFERGQFQLLDIILVFTFKASELLSWNLCTVSNLIIP